MYTSHTYQLGHFEGDASVFRPNYRCTFIICDDSIFHVRKIRMFLCLLVIWEIISSSEFSLFILIKVVYVCPGLEFTIGSVRNFVCSCSILSVSKRKEGWVCFLFSQISPTGRGTFTSVSNSFKSLVSQASLYKHVGGLELWDPLCFLSRWTFPSPAVNGRQSRTSLNCVLFVLHLAEII